METPCNLQGVLFKSFFASNLPKPIFAALLRKGLGLRSFSEEGPFV
jgi:hypothetical protein